MTIDWLKDKNTGEKFYPRTHEDAVLDSNNVTLSTKLAAITASIPEDKVFLVTYGTTTATQVIAAISGNKIPVCFYNDRCYVYSHVDTNYYYFYCVSDKLYWIKLYGDTPTWTSGNNSYELSTNKVISLSSGSTDTQYPSAKCVYNAIQAAAGSAGVSSYDELTNRPALSTTATTAQATAASETISGTIKLHKVSKTGTYSDLIGTPTIPTVGTLNTNVSTAQATASSESFSDTIKLHKIAKTGTYTDLLNRPTLGSASEKDVGDFAPSAHTHGYITSAGTITDDTTVASGMKLVTTNASGYVVRSSVVFGSDATKALTNAGTWVTFAASDHTHGKITNSGTITADTTVASGDKLVITDSSDSNKVARSSLSFDGSTVSVALTKKGTFEAFAPSALTSGYAAATDNSFPAAGNTLETAISKLHGLANYAGGELTNLYNGLTGITSSLISYSGDVYSSLVALSGISFDNVIYVYGDDWSEADDLNRGVYKVMFMQSNAVIKGGETKGEPTRDVICVGSGVLATGIINSSSTQILTSKQGLQYRTRNSGGWSSWQPFYVDTETMNTAISGGIFTIVSTAGISGSYNDLTDKPTIPSYAANIALSSSANYIREPEFKKVKINGSSTNAASSENCELQYDTENKCVKFVFN